MKGRELPEYHEAVDTGEMVEGTCEFCGRKYWLDLRRQAVLHEMPFCAEFEAINEALAYSRVLDQSELARKSEHERWLRYLLDLACREESGLVTSAQRATVLRLWERAQHMFPSLRRPAVGSDDQGRLHLAWAFQDLPDQELTIEIERDGKLDWFFRDPQKNIKLGSEHPVDTISDAELQNLGVFLQ